MPRRGCGIVDGVRTGFVVLVVVLLGSVAFGLYRRHRDGRLRTGSEMRLTAEDIGAPLGERATLLQFSTAFCQPCRATRRILGEVAGMADGVAHVEVDAESRLELVRRLGVLRTPTVFVLDAQGRVVKKASGQPRKADVIAALGETI